MSKLGEAINHLRERQDSSLSQLALDAGITKSHVWDMEQGNSLNPRVDTLIRLAFALDVKPQDLFLVAMEDWVLNNPVKTVTRKFPPKKASNRG